MSSQSERSSSCVDRRCVAAATHAGVDGQHWNGLQQRLGFSLAFALLVLLDGDDDVDVVAGIEEAGHCSAARDIDCDGAHAAWNDGVESDTRLWVGEAFLPNELSGQDALARYTTDGLCGVAEYCAGHVGQREFNVFEVFGLDGGALRHVVAGHDDLCCLLDSGDTGKLFLVIPDDGPDHRGGDAGRKERNQ